MYDEYTKKLDDFIFSELVKIKNPVFLEFGVREGVSTKKFIELCDKNEGMTYSIDIDDCSKVSNSNKWKFIQSRDDNFEYIQKQIPEKFDAILIDSFHNAEHVKKIIYYYYDKLKEGGYMFIDDVCWIPYVKNNYRNHFNSEINNRETFDMINEIIISNQKRINVFFSFVGSGMAKIKKNNNEKLDGPFKIFSRTHSIKNYIRKFFLIDSK